MLPRFTQHHCSSLHTLREKAKRNFSGFPTFFLFHARHYLATYSRGKRTPKQFVKMIYSSSLPLIIWSAIGCARARREGVGLPSLWQKDEQRVVLSILIQTQLNMHCGKQKMTVKRSSFAVRALCLFFSEALMTEFTKNQNLAAGQRWDLSLGREKKACSYNYPDWMDG